MNKEKTSFKIPAQGEILKVPGGEIWIERYNTNFGVGDVRGTMEVSFYFTNKELYFEYFPRATPKLEDKSEKSSPSPIFLEIEEEVL